MSKLTIQVTHCRISASPIENDRLKAFGTITLNDAFVVNVKVIDGFDGLFVAMPASPRKDGVFHDLAHPITSALRDHIEDVVLEAYYDAVSAAGSAQRTPERLPSARTGVPRLNHRLCEVGV